MTGGDQQAPEIPALIRRVPIRAALIYSSHPDQWKRQGGTVGKLPSKGLIPAGLLLVLSIALAAFFTQGRPVYTFLKEVVVPLVGPSIAILVPLFLFYSIPLAQSRQKTTIELFNAYHGEDMRDARAKAWKFFVTDRLQKDSAGAEEVLDNYLRYLADGPTNRRVAIQLHEEYQRLGRVLDFFAVVDDCLAKKTVDPDMVRTFIKYYFVWWNDEAMIPLRRARNSFHERHPPARQISPSFSIHWLSGLGTLEEVCK